MINQELLRTTALTVEMKNMKKRINSKAVFNQKDTKTAMLLCELRMDNEPIDLTGCAVSAEILKSDGKTVIQKGQIVNELNGTVAIGLTEQCLSSIGETICEIVVQYDNQILYSPKISYIVVDNLFDETEIESTNELPILNILIAEVLKAQSDLSLLENTITTNEQRRETEFLNIKSELEGISEINNSKIQEIENKVEEVNNTLKLVLEKLDDLTKETHDIGGL